MSVVITIVVVIIAGVCGLVLLAAAMPLRLELLLIKEDAIRFEAALRPFGHFGPRIGLSRRRKKQKVQPEATKKKKRRRKHRGLRDPLGLVRAAARFAMEFLGRVRIEDAICELTFGLGDPGETGQAYGALAPLIFGTSKCRGLNVSVEPVFDDAVFRGRLALTLSMVPLSIVPPATRFAWTVFGPRQ